MTVMTVMTVLFPNYRWGGGTLMKLMTLELRHTGNWISIPYAHITEIEWQCGEDHCMVNGRAVNADGPTLIEELKNG